MWVVEPSPDARQSRFSKFYGSKLGLVSPVATLLLGEIILTAVSVQVWQHVHISQADSSRTYTLHVAWDGDSQPNNKPTKQTKWQKIRHPVQFPSPMSKPQLPWQACAGLWCEFVLCRRAVCCVVLCAVPSCVCVSVCLSSSVEVRAVCLT